MPRRLTQEFVSSIIESKGSKLLSKYKWSREKLKVICALCGNEYWRTYQGILRSEKVLCIKCSNKKRALSKTKYTLDWYKKKAEKVGSEVLFLDNLYCHYICKCGKKWKSLKSNLWKDNVAIRCKTCGSKLGGSNQKLKYDFDTLNKKFEESGCKLITKNFKGVYSKVKFVCKCGNVGEIIIHNFEYGQIPRCKKCQIEKIPRGEKHYNWNPDLTEKERRFLNGRPQEIDKWYREVYNYWNKICVITGKIQDKNTKVSAHHLYSWNNYKDLRFEVTNGVCILTSLHKKFHRIYGYGNNTLEQFQDFFHKETEGGTFNHVINLNR